LLSKQSLQQYVEKIRDFERQRLLRGWVSKLHYYFALG
jgi:hypothetical protein